MAARRRVAAGLAAALLAGPAAAQPRPAARRPAGAAPPGTPTAPASPVPPAPAATPPGDPQAAMARAALAAVARFLIGRGGTLAAADGGVMTQEALDNVLADVDVARQVAEVFELPDLTLALAAWDAVARFAPPTVRRGFAFEPLLTNSGRVFPALNAATDAIDRAYAAAGGAAARRAVLADPARAADPAVPLPVLVAAAVAKAASQPPFVALEVMERCGRPGERPLSRPMLTAIGLAAPDIYDFFLRNFVEPGTEQARAAFIRNLRAAAARCAR